MSSDASGSLGFGAVLALTGYMANGPQNFSHPQFSITNFFPIVVASRVWGSSWFRQVMLFHCDNESVVFILKSRTSRAPDVMHLLRLLLMTTTHYNFIFSAQYIPGSDIKIPQMLYLVLIGRPVINWPHMPTVILQPSLLTFGKH